MLLGELDKVFVYQLDNQNFTLLGIVEDIISANWSKLFNKYSDVSFNVIPSERNIDLLKKGRVLWIGGDNAARIDVVEKSESDGNIVLQVKGQTLEKLLTTRVIHGQMVYFDTYVSRAMIGLVQYSCITPAKVLSDDTQEERNKAIIPFLEVMQDPPNLGRQLNNWSWRDRLYDKIKAFADTEPSIGFEILFKPESQKMVFQVYETQDHTINSNSPVVFSDSMESVLNLDYYSSNRDYKNLAYVYGEGEGWNRKITRVGDDTAVGFDRYEEFIDARDIQSEDEQEPSEEKYMEMLSDRGLEKLAELKEVETVSGKLDVNNSMFKYGIDYKLGDMITVVHNSLGIQIDAQVTGIKETVGNSYSTELVIGYDIRTLFEKIKNLYG